MTFKKRNNIFFIDVDQNINFMRSNNICQEEELLLEGCPSNWFIKHKSKKY